MKMVQLLILYIFAPFCFGAACLDCVFIVKDGLAHIACMALGPRSPRSSVSIRSISRMPISVCDTRALAFQYPAVGWLAAAHICLVRNDHII